jgi:hypothetical protein
MRIKSIKALMGLSVGAAIALTAGTSQAVVVDNVNLTAGPIFVGTDFVQNDPVAVGDTLKAAGRILAIGGVSNFCAVPGCQLTFVVNNYVNATGVVGGAIGFTGGTISIFEIDNPAVPFNTTTQTNLSVAQTKADPVGSHLFLQLAGHVGATPIGNFTLDALGTFSGAVLQALANGLLDVVGGDAAFFFDTNTISDLLGGHADLNFQGAGGSTNNHPAGSIFFTGTDSLQGFIVPVPEPGTLMVLGSSLLGLGLLRRRSGKR